jgi:hypothetical protein
MNTSGVLMENRRIKGEGRYISFDFDTDNSNAYKAALIDIHTSAASAKMKGFLSTGVLNDIITTKGDRDLLLDRIVTFQRLIKGQDQAKDKAAAELVEQINKISAVGVVLVLGKTSAVVLQSIPVLNSTFLNSRGRSGLRSITKPGAKKFIETSGRGQANRGIESATMLENYLNKLKKTEGDVNNLKKGIKEFRNVWMKGLIKTDKVFSDSAFLAYYSKYVYKNEGRRVVDWEQESENKNQDALDYAQSMLNDMQNITDSKKAGKAISTSQPIIRLTIKATLSFMSFVLNQKNRMHADAIVLLGRPGKINASDRIEAATSIAATVVESTTYAYISWLVGDFLYSIGANLLGYVPTKEEEDKRKKRAIQRGIGNVFVDLFSPSTIVDSYIRNRFNDVAYWAQTKNIDPKLIQEKVDEKNAELTQSNKDVMTDSEEIRFRNKTTEDLILEFKDYSPDKDFDLGSISIVYDKSKETLDMSKALLTGEMKITNSFGTKTVYLMPEDINTLRLMLAANAGYLFGFAPTEVNTVVRNMTKIIQNRALSETQREKYLEIKKLHPGRGISKIEDFIIRTDSDLKSSLHELELIKNVHGLTDAQTKVYIEVRNRLKSGALSVPNIDRIKEGRNADYIVKQKYI